MGDRKIEPLIPALPALIARLWQLRIVSDALQDSAYLAGAKAGWNAAQADDPNAAYARLTASRDEYLKPLALILKAKEAGS